MESALWTRAVARMHPVRLLVSGLCAALIGLGALATPAKAQDWPQRTVRLILPFGAGSATDLAARLLAERLSPKWGHPVVVENRPGGDALVAIKAFLTANDDHVLLYASTASFMAHPYTQEKLFYSLERDIAPIAIVTETVTSTAVPVATGIRTVAEFVERARAEPTKYSAVAAAGMPDFVLTAFLKTAKLDIAKVPYRDVVQAGTDLAASRIHFLLSSYAVVRPMVEAGKVRVIATGGSQRSAFLPDLPSALETGYPIMVRESMAGLYGPRGMALALRQRIAADVIEVAKQPTFERRIVESGQELRLGGPEVLADTLKRQTQAASVVAEVVGLKRKQ